MLSTWATCCNRTGSADEGYGATRKRLPESTLGHLRRRVSGNPATVYRSRLILRLLGDVDPDAVVLGIGRGQGEFTLLLAETYPHADVRAIDNSAEGVARATQTAPLEDCRCRLRSVIFCRRWNSTTRIGVEPRSLCAPRFWNTSTSPTCYFAARPTIWLPVLGSSSPCREVLARRSIAILDIVVTSLRDACRRLLEENKFEEIVIHRAGFPFFDLDKLLVIARGKRLIADIEQSKTALGEGTSGTALRFFTCAFRYNLDSSPFGWQLVAVARAVDRPCFVIITRTPLRITLGGGGTDLPSYYERFGGLVLSAAINRYVYIAINRTFTDDYFLKYSSLERVQNIDDIEHPIIREALRIHPIGPSIELASVADIPASTGLGSSGTFTVGLLRAIYAYLRQSRTIEQNAAEACHIEMDLLGRPVGKQDQYAAAYGGLQCMTLAHDGQVTVAPLGASDDTVLDLQEHLCMFFTGYHATPTPSSKNSVWARTVATLMSWTACISSRNSGSRVGTRCSVVTLPDSPLT